MKRSLLLLYIIIMCGINCMAATRTDYTRLDIGEIYRLLDASIDTFGMYKQERTAQIARMKHNLRQARTDEDRYLWAFSIYQQYKNFDSDSALAFVDKAHAMAMRVDRRDWILTTLFQKATLLASQGLYDKSVMVVKDINASKLTTTQKVEYYEYAIHSLFYQEIYTRQQDQQNMQQSMANRMTSYRDSLMSVLPKDDPRMLPMLSWSSIDNYYDKKSLIPYKKKLLQSVATYEMDNVVASKEAYILARVYKSAEDMPNYHKYLALSVLASVRSGELSSESTAMEELCVALQAEGDIERAYKYINFSYHNAVDYHDRARLVFTSAIQNKISHDYIQYNKKIGKRKTVYSYLLAIMLAIVLGATAYITKQNRELSSHRRRLREANLQLQHSLGEIKEKHEQLAKASEKEKLLNVQLDTANTRLKQANEVKDQYLGYAFSVCSQYISKLENYRKTVSKCIKDDKQRELRRLIALPILEQAELKEFYSNFDKVFLTIYPNFVDDLNTLLTPDQQFTQQSNDHLGAEIRVFALMRLGITDIDKIADFLHCSIQTVYNNRQKMYTRTDMDKKQFKEAIAKLGRPEYMPQA